MNSEAHRFIGEMSLLREVEDKAYAGPYRVERAKSTWYGELSCMQNIYVHAGFNWQMKSSVISAYE